MHLFQRNGNAPGSCHLLQRFHRQTTIFCLRPLDQATRLPGSLFENVARIIDRRASTISSLPPYKGRCFIKPHGLRLLPPAGGGWEGGTAQMVCPASFLNHLGFPPPRLPPLGGGNRGKGKA